MYLIEKNIDFRKQYVRETALFLVYDEVVDYIIN